MCMSVRVMVYVRVCVSVTRPNVQSCYADRCEHAVVD